MEEDLICICGHPESEHHIWWFLGKPDKNGKKDAIKVVDECEYYGANEFGGMKKGQNGEWENHCQNFKWAGGIETTTGINEEELLKQMRKYEENRDGNGHSER